MENDTHYTTASEMELRTMDKTIPMPAVTFANLDETMYPCQFCSLSLFQNTKIRTQYKFKKNKHQQNLD